MRSKIVALESQVQVCMQKFSHDGMKMLVLQMEGQKMLFEGKTLDALQRAITEKRKAEKRAESLQEALQAARAECSHWQSLYEDLKENCRQLQRRQEESSSQLQELQGQLKTASRREENLNDQLGALQLDGAVLHSHIAFLEEDDQAKKEQQQEPGGVSHEMWDSVGQGCVCDGRSVTDHLSWGGTTLQDTQQRLSMKEKECMELRMELEAMEHECHSYQARLTQCREELRLLNARKSKRRCGSWLGLALVLFMVAAIALVCVYHPPFSYQLQDFYRVLKQQMQQNLQHFHMVMKRHIQYYLQEVASPEHSGCYQPI